MSWNVYRFLSSETALVSPRLYLPSNSHIVPVSVDTMSGQSSANGLADPILLEKIDKLIACKVGEHVDLPQVSAILSVCQTF